MKNLSFLILVSSILFSSRFALAQTPGQIKSIVNSLQYAINIGNIPITARFSADVVSGGIGRFHIINPKLVVNGIFYGLNLDAKSAAAENELVSLKFLSRHVCSQIGKSVQTNSSSRIEFDSYPTHNLSLSIKFAQVGMYGTVVNRNAKIISSFICR